jgi:hypothetical protein
MTSKAQPNRTQNNEMQEIIKHKKKTNKNKNSAAGLQLYSPAAQTTSI